MSLYPKFAKRLSLLLLPYLLMIEPLYSLSVRLYCFPSSFNVSRSLWLRSETISSWRWTIFEWGMHHTYKVSCQVHKDCFFHTWKYCYRSYLFLFQLCFVACSLNYFAPAQRFFPKCLLLIFNIKLCPFPSDQFLARIQIAPLPVKSLNNLKHNDRPTKIQLL